MKDIATDPVVTRRSQDSEPQAVTRLLIACEAGDRTAFNRLVTLVYPEMRRIARRQLHRLRPGNTLATTGLVHEVYIKLIGQDQMQWNNHQHFYSVAACAMRQLLIDYTRRKQAGKRHAVLATLDEDRTVAETADAMWLLGLDQALKALEAVDSSLCRVVECIYFAGLTQDETARALGISTPTVSRKWRRARAWLHTELAADH